MRHESTPPIGARFRRAGALGLVLVLSSSGLAGATGAHARAAASGDALTIVRFRHRAGWSAEAMAKAVQAATAQSGNASAAGVRWSRAGPQLEVAVLEGDPNVDGGRYRVLLRLADGSWIPPHWHPRDKKIAVVEGTLLVGHGTEQRASATHPLETGQSMVMRARDVHFEGARGVTVVELSGTGPLATTFVSEGARP